MKQTEINNTKLLSLGKVVKHGGVILRTLDDHAEMRTESLNRTEQVVIYFQLKNTKYILVDGFYSYFTYKLKEKGTTLFSVIVNYQSTANHSSAQK